MLIGKKPKVKETVQKQEYKNLRDITSGRGIEDLIKVTSSRNCDVYKINQDLFLTAIKKEVYKDSLIVNIRELKREVEGEYFDTRTLSIYDIVEDEGSVIGYLTDSYDITLKDYFISEDPSLNTTRIILRLMSNLMMNEQGHGDISLDNFVLKNGELFLNNRLVRYENCQDDFYLLNDIEKEILAAHGHPCNIAMPVDQADIAVYDYYYYLLLNTTGEERKAFIEAGLESIYKTLFDTVPNKYVDEEDLAIAKECLTKVYYNKYGSIVNRFRVKLL